MIKIKQAALVGKDDPIPGHAMTHAWQIGKWPESFIDVAELHKIVSSRKTHEIDFDQIASKPYKAPLATDKLNYERYLNSDTAYPGYLVKMENPYSKQYRMIDGRRRLNKMKSEGLNSGHFIVFEYEEIHPYIWHVIRTGSLEPLIRRLNG